MKEDNRHPQESAQQSPSTGAGAHQKAPGERIKSRSADPGQSSYGGFSGEDPSRQSQELHEDGKGTPASATDKPRP
jgi:hypothetical protein